MEAGLRTDRAAIARVAVLTPWKTHKRN